MLTVAYIFVETLVVQGSGLEGTRYLLVNVQASTLQWLSYFEGSAISAPSFSFAVASGIDLLTLAGWILLTFFFIGLSLRRIRPKV
jgi:hypothetical protein